MQERRAHGWARTVVAIATVLVMSAVAAVLPGAGAAGAAGGPKLKNGAWDLYFSAILGCQPRSGTLALDGQGSLTVSKGNVRGTVQAAGPGACAFSGPAVSITYNGAYSWRNGSASGPSTAPKIAATSHFDGPVVTTTPAGSGTENLSSDNGPVTATLSITSATDKTALGSLEVEGTTVISGSFFATRNCPKGGKTAPLLDRHIPDGTPANPTRVNVVADPAIAGVPQLQAALQSTLDNWNNMLQAADKNIVFGTTPGNGPTIYVGIDSEAFRNNVASQTNTPALEALPGNNAGHADTLGNTSGSGFAFGEVRLGAENAAKGRTWATYAQSNPENVEGVLTHEFGHILGLAHDKNDTDSIMYPNNQSKREPTAGCSDLRALAQL